MGQKIIKGKGIEWIGSTGARNRIKAWLKKNSYDPSFAECFFEKLDASRDVKLPAKYTYKGTKLASYIEKQMNGLALTGANAAFREVWIPLALKEFYKDRGWYYTNDPDPEKDRSLYTEEFTEIMVRIGRRIKVKVEVENEAVQLWINKELKMEVLPDNLPGRHARRIEEEKAKRAEEAKRAEKARLAEEARRA